MSRYRSLTAPALILYAAASVLGALGAFAAPPVLAPWLHPSAGGMALAAAAALQGGARIGRAWLGFIGFCTALTALPLLPGVPTPPTGLAATLWPASIPPWQAALMLLWAAAAIALALRPGKRVRRAAMLTAAAIASAGLLGAISTVLRLPLIYAMPQLPAPPLAGSATLLGLGLVLAMQCRAHRPEQLGEEVRVTRIGIGFLVVVTLATTLTTLAALQTQIERSLYQQQRMTARNRELVFHYATERLYFDANVLLKDTEIGRLATLAQKRKDDATLRRLFQQIQGQVPFRVVRSFQVIGRDGQILTERGTLTQAETLWRDTKGAIDLQMKWHDGLPFAQLRLRIDLPGEGHVADLLLEQTVSPWEQLIGDTYDLGRTGVMSVCGFISEQVRCFQSGSQDRLWTPRAGSAMREAVDDALNGHSSPDWDPLIVRGDDGHPSVLVYAPLGRVGMAMGVAGNGIVMMVAQDAHEFYEPVRKQWHRILPAVLAVLLIAGWSLRRIVRPLISALRDKEARFRELTELSSDCYWQMDDKLRFSEIVGKDLSGAGILLGRWLGRDVTHLPLHHDDRTRAANIRAAMEQRTRFTDELLRITEGDGLRYLMLSGAPQYDARGRFVGYRGIGRDITRQRQAEERLRRAQTDLLRAERMASLGSLVAGVAHEMNTPIGNCVVTASALAEEASRFEQLANDGRMRRADLSDFTAYVREAMQLLRSGLDRAAGTIRKFKEVAVDQSSDRRLRFELSSKLSDIVGLLNPTLTRRGIVLVAHTPAGIEMDSFPGALAQIVDNLVLNALTHAFEGRERGRIELHVSLLPNDCIRLVLRDDGVGIERLLLDRVFEPFFTTRLGAGGSGLGLYIVRNIVQEVLAGSISVASDPGLGTTFTLEFPRITPETGAPHPEALR
ncbi:PAS domain-containing sensor histidine kinase [Niveibacterium sp. 24ML]|uniref:sensor histidine kinase n=1 Tax=Niveibacterium sp. 24ML TaxID=2985512 RepID=UPI00226F928A|nr:PAS domain-containing sensor histidine kinase [Niveibacterium sp. 24ML]MCX9154695.1 PAS domain-containing sensor histidine kinase [Niveibacterium sp. 24ML]